MKYNEWIEKYKPIENPNGGGIVFETYGFDVGFVAVQNPLCVWTDMDDGEDAFINSGIHLVNRVGYYVCAVPFEEDEFIQIVLEHRIDNEDGTMTVVDGEGNFIERLDPDGFHLD
jgi:hypothetical protein